VVCVLDHNLSHRCHVQAWHAIQAMSAKTHGTEWDVASDVNGASPEPLDPAHWHLLCVSA